MHGFMAVCSAQHGGYWWCTVLGRMLQQGSAHGVARFRKTLKTVTMQGAGGYLCRMQPRQAAR